MSERLAGQRGRRADQVPDPARDGADYRVAAMWLTDGVLAAFRQDLADVAQPRLADAPGKGRWRRILFTLVLPAPGQPAGHDAPS